MSRVSESRPEYGIIGAGGIGKSLIGRLPAKAREIGPVAGVSFRVASRLANVLRAGYPVRTPDALGRVPVLLFHAPPDQMATMLAILESTHFSWRGKSLIFCDCEVDSATRARLRDRGVSTAVLRQFGITGRVLLEGEGAALKTARRMAKALRLKPVGITGGSSVLFDAAITLSTCALTPLIDRAAVILRAAGVRESEAPRLASALFEKTAREYARSGRQSWGWHLQKPDVARLEAEIRAAGLPLLRELLLLGFDTFDRHGDVARKLRHRPVSPSR
jgi:hypothetical protein